ncbi:MAG: TetR/AcrR family transcriptional regulator [Alphaproteobacteria bacterium]|nr:MAG: TetR/AcrR family transcriptional regulator [Alphaproteobacteria bacterium]
MTTTPFYIDPNDPPAKQRILAEGLRLFASKGLSETTVRDIAAATGYSNPALYKHFPSKEALAQYLFALCYREQFSRLNTALKDRKDFDQSLREYLRTLARLYDEAPEATIFLANYLPDFWPHMPAAMKKRTVITLTRELLMKGRRERAVSRDHSLELQIALVTGTVTQLTRQLYLGATEGPATRLTSDLFRLLSAALR